FLRKVMEFAGVRFISHATQHLVGARVADRGGVNAVVVTGVNLVHNAATAEVRGNVNDGFELLADYVVAQNLRATVEVHLRRQRGTEVPAFAAGIAVGAIGCKQRTQVRQGIGDLVVLQQGQAGTAARLVEADHD